jgi:hypothetical protein
MMKDYAAAYLQKQFPETEILISDTDTDPISVI